MSQIEIKEDTNKDFSNPSTISKLIETVSKSLPSHKKLLMEAVLCREKRKISQAKKLINQGLNEVIIAESQQEKKANDASGSKSYDESLLTCKSELYYEKAQLSYHFDRKYTHCIAECEQSLDCVKNICDANHMSRLRTLELMGWSYRNLQEYDQALNHFNQLLYGIETHVTYCTEHPSQTNSNKLKFNS
ncbi:hypothetical protein RFI_20721 [Reticulomyxa filosa]|uniref:Uncharacterized protein n=1 Tax=Reticulomyxa filosa TaxID=46433 RepID=X6MS00_RETFI|nr:hypothetical protein RFI_20721 [Reticulomyxa filosa]|eukprot:ETO16614.1 hypothetical protein RFI_20721 [Reticulomyxa filosa]